MISYVQIAINRPAGRRHKRRLKLSILGSHVSETVDTHSRRREHSREYIASFQTRVKVCAQRIWTRNCALGVESSSASGLRRKSLPGRVQRPRLALQRPRMLPRGSSQEYASTIGHHSHDKGLSAFIRFTRPHTILGTTVRLVQSTSLASVSP